MSRAILRIESVNALQGSAYRGLDVKINLKKFRVAESTSVDLGKVATRVKPYYSSKGEYQKLLKDHVDREAVEQRRGCQDRHNQQRPRLGTGERIRLYRKWEDS